MRRYDLEFNKILMEEYYSNHQGLFELIGITLAILAIYISIIQPIINFTLAQKKQNKDKRFKIYHELIDHFAGANGSAMLDRQIAIIYELRRFPEYYPVTKRILSDWVKERNTSSIPQIQRLVKEMELTIKYINCSWFKRRFSKN